MNDATQSVKLEIRQDVAYVTLDSPPYNIMTCAMMDRLHTILGEVADDAAVKAVAFTANGKAFSAGADVGEHRPEEAPKLMTSFGALFRRIESLDVPVVMAVDGAALGGGFELVIMGDVIIATERAKFGQPEIRLGFFAPVGVTRLPALVGPAKAKEIVCSGRSYSAQEMREAGFVSRVVASEELIPSLESVLDDFRASSALILRMNVRMLRRVAGMNFNEGLAVAEKSFLEELMVTEDVREGIASFFEKRKPEWKNR